MTNLKTEYIDTKEIKHCVEHFVVPSEDDNNEERIAGELFRVLTKTDKRIAA